MNILILAGGQGLRATHLPPGTPKVLSSVAGRPVIGRLLDFVIEQGATSVTFVLGHSHASVYLWLVERAKAAPIPLRVCIEDHPAGTVGAVRHALKTFKFDPPVVVLNGDTLLDLNLREIVKYRGRDPGVTVVREDPYGPVVLRMLGADALAEVVPSEAKNIEDHLWACDASTVFCLPGSFVDVGTPEGYAASEEWLARGQP